MEELELYSTTRRKTLYALNKGIDEIMVSEVGEGYLEYRDLWNKVSHVELERDFPVQLEIELSSGCNLDCPMCPSALRRTEKKMVLLDFELYKKMIDEALENEVKSINLNYVNEPLYRKDIGRFIQYAREKGAFDVMFNSNGTLLTEETSRELIKSGLTKLSISLDATTEETYDKIRIGGDFKKVMKNIDRFLEIRDEMKSVLPLLKVTFVVSAVNNKELDGFVQFWKERADLISLQNMTNPFDGDQRQGLEKYMGIEGVKLNPDKKYRCPQPFQRMAIRYDGTVLPCCHFRGSALPIGNAKEQSLKEIYHSPFAKEIRAIHKEGDFAKNPVCKACVENSRLETYV